MCPSAFPCGSKGKSTAEAQRRHPDKPIRSVLSQFCCDILVAQQTLTCRTVILQYCQGLAVADRSEVEAIPIFIGGKAQSDCVILITASERLLVCELTARLLCGGQ